MSIDLGRSVALPSAVAEKLRSIRVADEALGLSRLTMARSCRTTAHITTTHQDGTCFAPAKPRCPLHVPVGAD